MCCLVVYRTEVLVTLTTDVGKLLSKLNQVRPRGNINFVSAIRIAHVSYASRVLMSHMTAHFGVVWLNTYDMWWLLESSY